MYEIWDSFKFEKKIKLLVIDEIQKVENWSEVIKDLWDNQNKMNGERLYNLILLGSSSLSIQKGLFESLAGRFE